MFPQQRVVRASSHSPTPGAALDQLIGCILIMAADSRTPLTTALLMDVGRSGGPSSERSQLLVDFLQCRREVAFAIGLFSDDDEREV